MRPDKNQTKAAVIRLSYKKIYIEKRADPSPM